MQLGLAFDVRVEADAGSAALRLVPTLLAGPAVLVAAAFVDTPGQELLWMAAAGVNFSGPVLIATAGWSVAPAQVVARCRIPKGS